MLAREDTNLRIKKTPWRISYIVFVIGLCTIATGRLLWSWPDATWQTNFLFIDDIDKLLSGDLNGVSWFAVGSGHALTGYRWFQYVNALVFSLNAQTEIVVYYVIIACLSLLIGLRILSRLDRDASLLPHFLVFLIPPVLASMAGAGSRGMELGTYTGILITALLFILVDTRLGYKKFLIVAILVTPLLFFIFSGGYSVGVLAAVFLVWLIQRLRPTGDQRSRRKLTVLLLCLISYGSIYVWALSSTSTGTTSLAFSQLWAKVSSEPIFPFKFLFMGNASALISSQNLESLSNSGATWIAIAVATLVATFVVLSIISALKYSWYGSTSPLLFIFYGLGTAVMLLLYRGFGEFQLLAPWYSLHFKVVLVGALWLIITSLNSTHSKYKFDTNVAIVLIPCLVGVLAFANITQFIRQPSERAYFLTNAKHTIFPNLLTEGNIGVTSLVIPLRESLVAVDILHKHHLGIFRNPSKVIRELAGPTAEFVATGSFYDDGWVGDSFSIATVRDICPRLTVTLHPYKNLIKNRMVVQSNFQEGYNISLDSGEQSLTFYPLDSVSVIDFSFAQSRVPSEIGDGMDRRKLTAKVSISCHNNPDKTAVTD